MATLAFERLQQMHLAAHLLTGKDCGFLKGFQREVIHNFFFFACIFPSWREAANACFNSTNCLLFLIYMPIFPPWIYTSVWLFCSKVILKESLAFWSILAAAAWSRSFLQNVSELNKAASVWPSVRSMTEQLALFSGSSTAEDESCQTARHRQTLTAI